MNASITLVAATGHQDSMPTRVPVRPLEPGDLPELISLHRHAYANHPQQHPSDLSWVGASLKGGRPRTAEAASLVAVGIDGQITAAIIITERYGQAVIAELFTHPDHRRQGLAEEILRYCMHVLRALGRTTVTVTVEESNSAALALYLSRDFRRLTEDDTDTNDD